MPRILRRKWIWLSLGLSAMAGGVATCAPARVLAPQMFGLTCTQTNICLDYMTRLQEATVLRDDALGFVTQRLGPLDTTPRVLMCSTADCFGTFADPRVAALYYWGADVILVNGIGWEPHILRHELIHHWQMQEFGLSAARRLPRWYIEGMAYTLSEDPRPTIPNAEAQAQRARFAAWIAEGNDWRVPPE